MTNRPTLRDLAKAAGVSVGTASQALRNDANTARATCARLQKLARDMGYRPDPILASLASRRFHRTRKLDQAPVIYITHADKQFLARNLRFRRQLRERLAGMGYAFRHLQVESPAALTRAARSFYHQGVRGVVFGLFPNVDWIRQADLSPFSLIYIGGRSPEPLLHTVKSDAAQATELVLSRLIQSGRKVGLLLHQHPTPLADDRAREGVGRSLLERVPKKQRVPILLESFTRPWEEQRIRATDWHQRHQPDLVAGLPIAFHLLVGSERGLGLGSFAALAMSPWNDFQGALEQLPEQADRAAEWLDSMIRHGEVGLPSSPLTLLVPTVWREKEQATVP